MSAPIRKVAVAGATGDTGPTVIKISHTSGFEVTALTHYAEKTKSLLEPEIKVIEVDYLSHDPLVSALCGHDAAVFCGVGIYAWIDPSTLRYSSDLFYIHLGYQSRSISSTQLSLPVSPASSLPTLRVTLLFLYIGS